MNNDQKIILSQEEKNKIIETTSKVHQIVIETASKVHQIVEEISAKRKKGKLEFLRHPLFIVIASALLSYWLIPLFLEQQSNNAERVKAKYELIKEMSLYKGRVITMAENVVYLHQKPIKDEDQIIATNKSFNETYNEFNSNFRRIDYELRIIFKNENINKRWAEIQRELKELDDLLGLLHEILTSDISEEHSERIETCKNEILMLIDKSDKLSDLMIKAL